MDNCTQVTLVLKKPLFDPVHPISLLCFAAKRLVLISSPSVPSSVLRSGVCPHHSIEHALWNVTKGFLIAKPTNSAQ